MSIEFDEGPRVVGSLVLLVPDSGRTWSIRYDQINLIPPDQVQRGDVFIVRHPTEPGVMLMQAVAPHDNAWRLEAVQLAPKGPSN